MRTYTTIQGDMWDSIAFSQMESDAHIGDLMLANRKYLGYYIFPAGIELIIPDITEDNVPDTLPPWKQVNDGE